MANREIPKTLSVFMLTMINVATIGSIKNWPVTAEYGFSSVFFLLLATVIFFIPTALVSAELASAYPHLGGVFFWVKKAFGHRFGFLSAWLLWLQNVVWYPTILSFVALTIAYIIDPDLANHKVYTCLTILSLFWLITFINLKGMRVSGWISSLGTILGTFLPGLFIIALGGAWFFSQQSAQIEFSTKTFFPDMSSASHLALFAGVLLSLAGIEMSAVHAKDVKNPKKDYPKAILFSALIILALSIPGILSIALVVPQQEINLVAGSLQAITIFLESYHLKQLAPYLALCITIGALSSVSTWVAGPAKALLAAAEEGDLPERFKKKNKQGMPAHLMIVQACVVSILSFIFVFSPSFNQSLWMLTAILSILYLTMYLLLFAAGLTLRFKEPHTPRPFKIPGGKIGTALVCLTGFLSALFAIIIGFFPPNQIPIDNIPIYVMTLIGGVIFFATTPFLLLILRKK